jgi:hypothetical protein
MCWDALQKARCPCLAPQPLGTQQNHTIRQGWRCTVRSQDVTEGPCTHTSENQLGPPNLESQAHYKAPQLLPATPQTAPQPASAPPAHTLPLLLLKLLASVATASLLLLMLNVRENRGLEQLHHVPLTHWDNWRQLVALPPVLVACCCRRYYYGTMAGVAMPGPTPIRKQDKMLHRDYCTVIIA